MTLYLICVCLAMTRRAVYKNHNSKLFSFRMIPLWLILYLAFVVILLNYSHLIDFYCTNFHSHNLLYMFLAMRHSVELKAHNTALGIFRDIPSSESRIWTLSTGRKSLKMSMVEGYSKSFIACFGHISIKIMLKKSRAKEKIEKN